MDIHSILYFFGIDPRGKLIISLSQFLLFFMMWYMLFSEFLRLKRKELMFKATAASIIEIKNLLTSFILIGLIIARIKYPPRWFSLLVSDLFTIVLVSLAYAFVGTLKEVDFISWGRKPILAPNVSLAAVGTILLAFNLLYLKNPTKALISINLLNTYIICWILFQTLLYRKKYKIVVAIPFSFLLHNHIITILSLENIAYPLAFKFLKTFLPSLIPLFFTSALFRELIDSINLFNETLKTSLARERELIKSLRKVSRELTSTSQKVRDTAYSTWENFSSINDAVLSTENALNNMENVASEVLSHISCLLENTQTLLIKFTEVREKISGIAREAENTQSMTEETLNNISDLRNFAEQVTLTLNELQEVAESVSEIAETITRLSEETNLISLNASVEAARSGVPGFAVVAQKVRTLAEKSKEHASVVQQTIEEIKDRTRSTIKTIEELIKRTEKTSLITKKTGDSILNFIDELLKALTSWNELQKILDAEKEKLMAIENSIENLKEQVNIVKNRMKEVKIRVGEEGRNVEILMESIETLNDIVQTLNRNAEETDRQARKIEKVTLSAG